MFLKRKLIWYNLRTFRMFKFIAKNIKEFGFWKWFALEFNNGWYSTYTFEWPVFLKSLFNYFIGHPFLGFGISSIWVIGFGMDKEYVYVPILTLVILEELRQTIIVKLAAKWWPIDSLFDILTWISGGVIFNLAY